MIVIAGLTSLTLVADPASRERFGLVCQVAMTTQPDPGKPAGPSKAEVRRLNIDLARGIVCFEANSCAKIAEVMPDHFTLVDEGPGVDVRGLSHRIEVNRVTGAYKEWLALPVAGLFTHTEGSCHKGPWTSAAAPMTMF